MKEQIISALNQSIPTSEYHDYIHFLQYYPGLDKEEKQLYLYTALFKDPKTFLTHIKFFLKNFIGANRPSKQEKIKFASFLKTINDLCYNNPILLNLNGKIQYAWDLHFLTQYPKITGIKILTNDDIDAENIRSLLKQLIQDAGFQISNPKHIGNNIKNNIAEEFIEIAPAFIETLGERICHPLFVDHEQGVCTLFMLDQSKFIRYCTILSAMPVNLNDWYVLWEIDLELVKFCAFNLERLNILLQAGIAFPSLVTLAQIDTHLFEWMLANATHISPLVQSEWLSMGSLLSLAKQNRSDCQTYLKHAHQLTGFQTADIPFAILLTGNAKINCYYAKEILSAIALRENFDYLITHPKVNVEEFYPLVESFELPNTDIFILACVQNEAFRMLIQHPDKVHTLLNGGFEFDSLYNSKNLSTILECMNEVLDLLSHDIPLQIFENWDKLSLVELLNHRTALIELRKTGISLEQFSTLRDAYPQHALLILKNPENLHAKWWIRQQLKKQNNVVKKIQPLTKVKGKYRIVFDLDNSTVSYTTHRSNAAWVSEFKEKNLYFDVRNDSKQTPCLHIIHPGFIELLRLLYIRGVETSIFSAGNKTRNLPLANDIYTKALGNPAYQTTPLNIQVCSQNHMVGPHKDLERIVKTGEDLKQIILIDDNPHYNHPKQLANFMKISVATDNTFENIIQTESPIEDSDIRAANHIFYITGLLTKVIKIAEKGCSLSEAFCKVLVPPDPNGTVMSRDITAQDVHERPNTLFQYQTYYDKGLKHLQKINLRIQLVTPGKFFAEGYTLNPPQHHIMVASSDGDALETKEHHSEELQCKV